MPKPAVFAFEAATSVRSSSLFEPDKPARVIVAKVDAVATAFSPRA
jgi:hypothetical protein